MINQAPCHPEERRISTLIIMPPVKAFLYKTLNPKQLGFFYFIFIHATFWAFLHLKAKKEDDLFF
jgi:hypothetical protein